jgi:hypothetical protein
MDRHPVHQWTQAITCTDDPVGPAVQSNPGTRWGITGRTGFESHSDTTVEWHGTFAAKTPIERKIADVTDDWFRNRFDAIIWLGATRAGEGRAPRQPGLIPPRHRYTIPMYTKSRLGSSRPGRFRTPAGRAPLSCPPGAGFVCIVAGYGTNGVSAHPQPRLELATKSGGDRCRVFRPVPTQTPAVAATAAIPQKENAVPALSGPLSSRSQVVSDVGVQPEQTQRRGQLAGRRARTDQRPPPICQIPFPHPARSAREQSRCVGTDRRA